MALYDEQDKLLAEVTFPDTADGAVDKTTIINIRRRAGDNSPVCGAGNDRCSLSNNSSSRSAIY
ncbi:hypothetical protein [Enterocloster clostridioformis]|uniref:hypothetical protein n=1 Tax=Enterocloster clostridioformis TaxID=1531 RepID=UPI00325A5E1D